jgi:hypothetical protein
MVRGNDLFSGVFYGESTGCKPLLNINIINKRDDRLDLLKPFSGIAEKLASFLGRTDRGNDG